MRRSPGGVATEHPSRPATRGEARAWGVGRLLAAGLDTREAWVEAGLLLRHAAGLTREEVLLRPTAPLGEAAAAAFASLIERRAGGCPSAYLTGRCEFYGLTLAVDPRVLVPRPETERLVEVAAAALAAYPAPLVVDVGTGSGAIALALAHLVSGAHVVATDVSEDALAVARANADALGFAGRITWAAGDALDALRGIVPPGGADAICANPPYVPTGDVAALAREIREHEPPGALDGGPDGLAVHRRIVAAAAAFLKPGGLLALETSALGRQAHAVAAMITEQGGFASTRIVRDHAGLDRVVTARRDRPSGVAAPAPASGGPGAAAAEGKAVS